MEALPESVLALATERELELYHAALEHGSSRQAAAALGMTSDAVGKAIRRLKARASQKGEAPGFWEYGSPEGFSIKNATVMFNHKTGEVERSWPRFHGEKDDQVLLDALQSRIDSMPVQPSVSPPQTFGGEKLFNQVSIFDGHIGAHAWGKETGSGNWDLKVAKESLISGAAWLLENLPSARDCLVLIGGDFTETDGYKALTPESGHLLDADGRYPLVVETAEEVIETTVLHALQIYNNVTLKIMPGNHDKSTSMMLRRIMMRAFRDNPRVHVDECIRNYWCMAFGQSLIACHHGDKAKLEQLPMIFAADFAPQWGRTTYRVCHSGHWHHEKTIVSRGRELTGMYMIQHPTLERRNAWASEKGLIAARQLAGHSYHEAGALVTTLNYNPDLF